MSNMLRTIFLLGVLSVFLIVIGSIFAGRDGLYFAFFLSLVINGIAYFFSDKIALLASGAKMVKKAEAPKLYQMVEELTRKANMPMPKLYLTPQAQANAFATGRDPNHASVAVTQGLIRLLPQEQTKAVLAHELSHIKNRDILIASVAAVLASSVAFLSRMGMYQTYQRDEEHRGSPALAMILAVFGPLAAMLIQFAISRQREFAADEAGAKLTGSGEPLSKALIAIHDSAKRFPMFGVNPAFSSLYIGNPFGGMAQGFVNLFSTHPPVEERVKRLMVIEDQLAFPPL